MTLGDIRFLKAVGIAACSVDATPVSLSLPPPPEPMIPTLTEKHSRWLQQLGVMWEQDPEPDFVPPNALPEYLARYPRGVRKIVGEVAKEMGLAMPDGGLDDLAQEITRIFLDFAALSLEDIVELYGFCKSMRPGQCGAGDFHAYIRFGVAACVPVVLRDGPPGERNW